MIKTYLSYNNIISSLGFSSDEVVANISNEVTGLEQIIDHDLLAVPFYSSVIDKQKLNNEFEKLNAIEEYTILERIMILSLYEVIRKSGLEINERVGIIISTTKGNINVLEEGSSFPSERAYLSELGRRIAEFFGFKTEPMVLSNACVSGVLAVSVAKRMINQGKFDHLFIVSGDLVTEFILSGFNSFQALSEDRCKPYSKDRTGINLGEVGASILVTSEKTNLPEEAVEILGEASCNDANHISGPSRTGEGLYRSVKAAISEAQISTMSIDYISAHGTATSFNDEMEAIAFDRLGLNDTPLNSLKGYFGHTLGASGLVETIVGMHSLYHNTLYKSLGFEELGVSKAINVIESTSSAPLKTFLKTSSGFGGCNTAAIFQKID